MIFELKEGVKLVINHQFFVILQTLKLNSKNLITMKKILLSLFCFALFTGVFSQSFSLTYADGTAINAGATIQFLGDPTDEVIQAIVYVKNNSTETKDVKVKKVINEGDTLPLTVNTFCWGLCYPPSTYVSPFSQTIEPDSVCTQFYGDYNPLTFPGVSKIMYVFFDINNTNDTVAVTVEYNASPASVGEKLSKFVKFSEAYPNPAIESINVDYVISTYVNKASIVIMNMLGSKVKEVTLDNRSGKVRINVSDLINGIYFYSLVADDQMVLTRKFVVKR
jgi:hypothetical protein